jgi:hypothetical protein
MKVKTTHHICADRLDRIAYIGTTIGFGEILFSRHSEERDSTLCLTDTGVVIVKNKFDRVITAYVASSMSQVTYITRGQTPVWLTKRIKHNLKLNHHILSNCS